VGHNSGPAPMNADAMRVERARRDGDPKSLIGIATNNVILRSKPLRPGRRWRIINKQELRSEDRKKRAPPKTPSEKWNDLSPPQRLKEYAKSVGYVVAQGVGAVALLTTGAEVFLGPEVSPYIHLDPTRAQDIFFGLCVYYGLPLFFGHRKGRADGG